MNLGARRGLRVNMLRSRMGDFLIAGDGALTQPVNTSSFVTSGPRALGSRFIEIGDTGLVLVNFGVSWGLGSSYGSGDAYVWQLPFPAREDDSTAMRMIGSGMVYKPFAGTEVMMVRPVMAPPFASLRGQHRHYVALRYRQTYSKGTGTIASGTSSIAITHEQPYAPHASDIHIMPTSYSGTNNQGGNTMWVDNITSTQFTVNCRANPSTDIVFGWKVCGHPQSAGGSYPELVGPNKPWAWEGLDIIIAQALYERAR